MTEVKAKDIPLEQQLFVDIWNICKKYYNASNDEDWQKFINETDVVYKEKYKNTACDKMCVDMVSSLGEHISSLNKNVKGAVA